MRALLVTNMYPSAARPALGSFVRDQVDALRRIDGVEVDLFAFSPGGAGPYVKAAHKLWQNRAERYDVVHAHFGLTAWPALAAAAKAHAVTLHGTDLVHPRSRALTLAALPLLDLVATVSDPLARHVPGWAVRGQTAVLPCGVDLERFRAISRAEARGELGLERSGRYVLFPADPTRPEKRYDRALAATGSQAEILTLGNVDPTEVPLYVNAANAVLVPSERESFGLAVLEALACDVPVLATPVGIAPTVLKDLPGTLCTEFDATAWHAALEPHLDADDPRVDGRARAEAYSTDRMAAQVLAAWRALV
ncbi:MAG TPA: glycosyltransferase [Solirubrobacteraceae bacterium]|nr:glycosyltransferase [Solirubrobacteraceae bacterium]